VGNVAFSHQRTVEAWSTSDVALSRRLDYFFSAQDKSVLPFRYSVPDLARFHA
jgi:hypothetical protein